MAIQTPILSRFVFEYTTLSRIRAEGITSGTLTDAQVRTLIRQFSKLINQVTGQWFWPIESKERLNGKGFPVVTHPYMIPILELRSLERESSYIYDSSPSSYDTTQYVTHDRYIELVGYNSIEGGLGATYKRTSFSKTRPLNVIADGTWGWLENRPFVSSPYDTYPKLSTTTSASLANGGSSIAVVNGSGFRVNDVVIFRTGAAGDTYAGHAILTAVAGNTLSFDAVNLNTTTLASGTNVVTYGQVPESVDRACAILVIQYKDALSSSSASSASISSRIISERTDNYSYQLSDDAAAVSGSGVTTGSVEADKLLSSYCAPPFLGCI